MKKSPTRSPRADLAPAPQSPPKADPANYGGWVERWGRANREAGAARRLVAKCHDDRGWLAGMAAEPLTTALLEAYDAYPEMAIDYPTSELADAIAGAPSAGPEQTLNNLMIASRIDPTEDRTLAVLVASRNLMTPAKLLREITQWLETKPTRGRVSRLLLSLASDEPAAEILEVIGRLSAYRSGRSLSTGLIEKFGVLLTRPGADPGHLLPSGAALVRASQAIHAAQASTLAAGDNLVQSLAVVQQLRACMSRAGYDVDTPSRAPRARAIADPSNISTWPQHLARQAGGRLKAGYLETTVAERSAQGDGLTANALAPYELARTPMLELPNGRYRATFNGSAAAEAVLRCEVAGFTGQRGRHSFAVSTKSVSAADGVSIFGVLEFVLLERAAEVIFSIDVQTASGSVTLAEIDLQRMDD